MKVRKNTASPKATRIFTDRSDPRIAFWNKYNAVKAELLQEDSNVYVLNFYGIGGIGKSCLLKKLMSEMDEQVSSPRYVYIDLNICQESKVVLDRMKNKLADSCKFCFPLFELGCYAYAKKIGENADPIEVKQLIAESPVLSMMLSVAEEIPVVGIAARVLSLADQVVAYIRSHLKNHSRELRQIEIMEPEELYKFLPYLFAQDLTHNLEKESSEPLVILLDTYEKLVNELSAVGEPSKNDEWIRGVNGLVQNVPNVLWVIAGREKLKWEKFDTGWADALESHNLGSLSSDDSKNFLQNAGIEDPELREQLCKLTGGTPVYLDLCVDRFLRITENGETPDISMFGKNSFELIERFVRYMGETQKDLVYMLACLSKWDDGLVADIVPSVLLNFSFTSYEKAKDYSFIIASDYGFYNLHQTVGTVLMNNCPDSIKQRVGNALLEKFSKALEEKNLFSQEFSTALTYTAQAGLLLHKSRDELCGFYKEKISDNLVDLAQAGQLEQAKAVFEMISEAAEQNKTDLFYASVINDKSLFSRATGSYSHAKKLAETALELYSAQMGDDHPDTLKVMGNLALTLYDLGEYQKTMDLEQVVLEKRRAILGEDHPETLTAMINLACTLSDLGEHQEALLLKQTAFEKHKAILGEDHPDTLTAMNNLACALKDLGEHQKALELYQAVLEKRKAILGEDHPGTLRAMNNMALTLDVLEEHQKSLELKQIVLEKRKLILGEDHPDTLTAMNNMALTLDTLGEHQKALELYQAVLEKRSTLLGENHPRTLTAMNNMATTLVALGEHQKARELLQTVLEKRKAILGENHLDTLMAMGNLAVTLYDLGENQEARELLQAVLEKRRDIYGENHPKTVNVMKKLMATLEKLGETEKAAALQERINKLSES